MWVGLVVVAVAQELEAEAALVELVVEAVDLVEQDPVAE